MFENPTVSLGTWHFVLLVREDRVLFVGVDLRVSLCWQQHPKCERAIRLVYPPFFRKLALHPTPQTKM